MFYINKLEVEGNDNYLSATSSIQFDKKSGKNFVSINATTMRPLKQLKVRPFLNERFLNEILEHIFLYFYFFFSILVHNSNVHE